MNDTLNPALFSAVDCLVPIPLHPTRIREREFNQSELIANGLSLLFKKPVHAALKKIKNNRSQTFFSPTQRFKNSQDTFALTQSASIAEKNILLIDDVVTTAATVSEAARVLKKAHAQSISVLAFAQG
jgi:ComF family protein